MEILIAIIGSSALAALISGIFTLIAAKKQRKTDYGEAIMVLLWNELDGQCKRYIEEGHITADDMNRILKMHKCYKSLGGNGYLDTLMSNVKNLPLK